MGEDAPRTPFKLSGGDQIDTTDGTGYDWLHRFGEAQALVQGNLMFAAFKLGQVGASGKFAPPEVAREMIEDMKTDRRDLQFAFTEMDKVLASIIENAERNLDA